mmetsp:Transcript_23025/g.36660  ORF Transcript_23025/g.36660 Transcript_23025/m.36660 type:complete len:301 (-) Transcript_23025:1569-2471(-)
MDFPLQLVELLLETVILVLDLFDLRNGVLCVLQTRLDLFILLLGFSLPLLQFVAEACVIPLQLHFGHPCLHISLDGLSLVPQDLTVVDGLCHFLDLPLLLLFQVRQTLLHDIDFLFHAVDLLFAHVGIQSHFCFFGNLDLLLPEHDLPFRFQNIVEQPLFFLLHVFNFILQRNGLHFTLLQPQDEVVLQVVAVVGDALLLGAVGRDQLVELLLLLVHHGHVVLQLIDLLRLLLGIVCQSHLLLLQDGGLGLQLQDAVVQLGGVILGVDQLRLGLDPVPLQLVVLRGLDCNGFGQVVDGGL